jgi:hypothetical protein
MVNRINIHFDPKVRTERMPPALAWRDVTFLVSLILLAMIVPSLPASAQVVLQVVSDHGLPGLHHSALSRFLAAEMAQAGLAGWRFAPANAETAVAPDRVEWSFTLKPYAGGEVRSHVHSPAEAVGFPERRPVTIEARLYLKGVYQTLVATQANVRSGPDDPDLAAAVIGATRNLLGPNGAYRAIQLGQRPAARAN